MPRGTTVQVQLHSIRKSVTALERALTRLARQLRKVPSPAAAGPTAPRRLKISPKRRAALKLHGSYIGHLRQLKPRQKAKVRATKAERGYHAAIKLARQLAGR